ncbi:MAG: hypothetical protein LBB88_10900 [Planctomycetaceae bacterium]|jgi:tetratricopeptide (TPR) repeat protein|nr:hypothetical protein [Planctomycetaceae bacterium]
MSTTSAASFFSIAIEAAFKLKTPMASAGILNAVASAQLDAGLLDDAFITIDKFSVFSERRSFLLNSAINAANKKESEKVFCLLQKLIEIDPESSAVAGRLAQMFLENNEFETAIKIVKSIKNPFDSWRSRFEFAVNVLEFNIDAAREIIETIKDVDYRDWGELAFAQRIIKTGDFNAAIKTIDRFSTSLRRAWSCFELSKLSVRGSAEELRLFELAESIFDSIDVDSKNAESIAIALRIIGKFAYNSGSLTEKKNDSTTQNGVAIKAIGERFLELSESSITLIPATVQRLRAKLFLTGDLLELRLIDGAKNYIDRRELENDEFNAIDQSKIWQWSAESDPRCESDWTKAVKAVSFAQRKSEELGFAERMSEIIRRFALRNCKFQPCGKPEEDSRNLSARLFEEHYYSPFAIENCEC